MIDSLNPQLDWKSADIRVRRNVTANTSDADQRRKQFEDLVTPIMAALYRRALRLVRSASAADDLVQETVFRAWKNFDRFQAGSRFRQWVFQIMTYHFYSELREARRKRRLYQRMQLEGSHKSDPQDHWAENPIGLWGSHSEMLCEDEVKSAIDQLPPDQSVLLLLVALADHSYQDAAQYFQVPPGTIMSRLHRARQKLKAELAS